MPRDLEPLIVTPIEAPRYLDAARALLYQTYCEELSWRPPPGNPSQQRVVLLDDQRPGLVDAYDAHARWLGLFRADELVGCLRLIARRDGSVLELERYFTLPSDFADGTPLTECNRLALDPRIRGRGGAVLLHLALLRLVAASAESVIIVATPATGRLAMWLLAMVDTGLSFRYHPQEPEAAHVYLMLNRGTAVEDQIQVLEAYLQRAGR